MGLSSSGSARSIHSPTFTARLAPKWWVPVKFQSPPTGSRRSNALPAWSPSRPVDPTLPQRPTPKKGRRSALPNYCLPVTARLTSLKVNVARLTSMLRLPHRNSTEVPKDPMPPAVTPMRSCMSSAGSWAASGDASRPAGEKNRTQSRATRRANPLGLSHANPAGPPLAVCVGIPPSACRPELLGPMEQVSVRRNFMAPEYRRIGGLGLSWKRDTIVWTSS